MEKSGLIALGRGKARNYEIFFLKRNPFPAVGVPGEAPHITVDRREDIERFQNVVAELLDVGTAIITVLVGDYGSGKSHLLKLFKYNVNAQLLSTENGVLATYVKSPGEDFRDFLLGLVEDIGRPLLTNYSEQVIKDHLGSDKAKAEAHLYQKDFRDTFREGTWDIGTFLQSSRYLDLFREIRQTHFRGIRSDDLVSAFLALSHPDHSSKAWRWFLGERLDKEEKVSAGVEIGIEDDDAAYSVFRGLRSLLKAIGIKSLVIMVDELEKITYIYATKRAKYQDILRQMIDDNTSDICFYFAIAPRQWEDLTKEPTAFVRRLAGNWYLLENFEENYTKELVERYLDVARTDSFSSRAARAKFQDCQASLCPFTNESIDAVQEISHGKASEILLVCRKLLEHLYDNRDKYQSITKGFVDYVKKREHWLEQKQP